MRPCASFRLAPNAAVLPYLPLPYCGFQARTSQKLLLCDHPHSLGYVPRAIMEQLCAKQTYRPKTKLEPFYTSGAARLTRDGKYVLCACGDDVKVVEVLTGNVTRTFAGDSEPITALVVSPDNKTLIAASRSLMCRCYNLETGEMIRSWKAHKSPVADMAVDSSGGYVATASADRSIRVWDIQGGFCTHSFTGHR